MLKEFIETYFNDFLYIFPIILIVLTLLFIYGTIKTCFKELKTNNQILYNKGFCWASGEIINGKTYDEIYSHVDISTQCGLANDFDKGVKYALQLAVEKGILIKN